MRVRDKNVLAVIEQMITRRDVGFMKYGVTTERTDLTTIDWIQHALEETMDLAVYLQRIKTNLEKGLNPNEPS